MDELEIGLRVIESLALLLLVYVAVGIAQLKHAVFGPKGDNGMYKAVGDLKRWRYEHDLWHAANCKEGTKQV